MVNIGHGARTPRAGFHHVEPMAKPVLNCIVAYIFIAMYKFSLDRSRTWYWMDCLRFSRFRYLELACCSVSSVLALGQEHAPLSLSKRSGVPAAQGKGHILAPFFPVGYHEYTYEMRLHGWETFHDIHESCHVAKEPVAKEPQEQRWLLCLLCKGASIDTLSASGVWLCATCRQGGNVCHTFSQCDSQGEAGTVGSFLCGGPRGGFPARNAREGKDPRCPG